MATTGECSERGSMATTGECSVRKRVCVTGAGGFLASWLVKLLLSKGYIVHGTVRDPGDSKNVHLKTLEHAADNLQLFKADILDFHAVASAIAGCEGVFHLASPVLADEPANPMEEVVVPAVTGTLNVLKACSDAKVKRVVVVSSLVAIAVNPSWPKDKIKDEDCWSDAEYCRRNGHWYFLAKTLAEWEAVGYTAKHGLDVVTVCPSLILGPLLQPTVNATSFYLINLLKGTIMEDRLQYIVDVRDVADALLLVYEEPKASGRYLCSPHVLKIQDLVDTLKRLYPHYKYSENFREAGEGRSFTGLHSEKLKNLGWKWRKLEETLTASIECYQAARLVDKEQ